MNHVKASYDPGGKGHRLLEKLAGGPQSRADLLSGEHEKSPYVLASLQHHGLVRALHPDYAITGAGQAALALLMSGQKVTARREEQSSTHVRVFPPREAA